MNDIFFENIILSTLLYIGVGYLLCSAALGYIIFLYTIKSKAKELKIPHIFTKLLIAIQLVIAFFGILIAPSIFLSEYVENSRASDSIVFFLTIIVMLAFVIGVVKYWSSKFEEQTKSENSRR